jgi:hypothetical protein
MIRSRSALLATEEKQMSCRRIASHLGLLMLFVGSSIQAADPLQRQWRFKVLLDGKPVGHHHVDLSTREGSVEYRSETKLDVKILFLTVFRYLHVDRESWRADCLASIESSTDDDGKAQFVRGAQGGSSFTLSTEHGNAELASSCVMTFAYWNPRVLQAERLMNAQTGEYIAVQVKSLGRDQILAGGKKIDTNRYAIVGEKLNIELWYTPEGHWTALATNTERGNRLQYVLP